MAWSIWIGVIAGSLELSIFWFKCRFLDIRNLNLSRQMLWMFPVAGLLVIGSSGLVLCVMSSGLRGRIRPFYALFSMVFLAYVGLLFRAPIYTLVCVLLGASLAWKTALYVEKRISRIDPWIVGRLWIPVGWLAILFGISAGREIWRPRLSHETQQVGQTIKNRKNVILLVMDTVRAQSLGLYAHDRDTSPQLTRISKKGVRFDRAFSTAPWTAPSHASMFTGRWPHELSIGWDRPLDSTFPTIAEVLESQGYVTAGFVANTTYCSYETGLDRGFLHYEDYDVTFRGICLCSSIIERSLNFINKHPILADLAVDNGNSSGDRKNALRMNHDFLRWLDASPRDKPFFAFINYYDAHHPYLTPEGDKAPTFGRKPNQPRDFRLLKTWWERDKRQLSPGDREFVRDAYEQCIASLDEQIGKLFDNLQARGLLENSILVITSDHGEHLGEHELFGHGCSLYGPELHVPLLIIAPGLTPEASVVEESVSLRDIPSTIIDLLGLGEDSRFPGESLTRVIPGMRGSSDASREVLSELRSPPELDPNGGRSPAVNGAMRSIVSQGLHYIRGGDGREELYDMDRDPDERNNLADRPEMSITLHQFRAGVRR